MPSSKTPRVTRSMSSQPQPGEVSASSTAPGPPIPQGDTSITSESFPIPPTTSDVGSSSFQAPSSSVQSNLSPALDYNYGSGQHGSSRMGYSHSTVQPVDTFGVDFVIPFSLAIPKGTNRSQAQGEIKDAYESLLRALEGEGGLKVASRKGRAKDEVWVFVSVGEEKLAELVERENLLDKAHNLPHHPHPIPPTAATRLRLLYNLLTSPPIQHGLGITPGEGAWKRVKSIAALHDEQADKAWVERWTVGGDWRVGLMRGLDGRDGSGIGQHQPPPVHLYFDFLTTYTLSLLPLSAISILFYLLSPTDSYPPLYALVLCLYSTIFTAVWKVRERKLAVRWGTRGCESVAVGKLRPEYVASLHPSGGQASFRSGNAGSAGFGGNVSSSGSGMSGGSGSAGGGSGGGEQAVDVVHAEDTGSRDVKMIASVPVIAACGVGLGVVLMGIFVLEAFVSQLWEGPGQSVVPIIPTALFTLIVPQIVGGYQTLAKLLVKWENHPTPMGAEKSLTAKTFAVNGIVAYLGLFLSAYVYVPFGSLIMGHVQKGLYRYQGGNIKLSSTPEKAGLGPRTDAGRQHSIKAGRLKGQLFAYTVTNQAVNMFLELGLPYIMRFINDLRAGKTTIKEKIEEVSGSGNTEAPARTQEEMEVRFMDKVERELGLPDYNLFTDYAEMATQFGYVTIWSIVWPLAPVFALINNYVELRSDALKICQHVRRPVGDRVESIGSWLQTLSIISWIGAITNATLIYLFRPSHTLAHSSQTPNPNVPPYPGSAHLANIVSTYTTSPTLQTLLPTLIPLALVALAASHGFIVLRWIVDAIVERVLWRGSREEVEVQKMRARGDKGLREQLRGLGKREYGELRGGFWNGGEEGAREIGRAIKAE